MRGLCAVIFGCLALVLIASSGCSKKDPCATDSDCSSGQACYYPIGDCGSRGECLDPPSGARCGLIEYLCSCNGASVITGCGFPDGYASGPTTGKNVLYAGDSEPAPSCSPSNEADAETTDAANE